jgi:hypothetical protein
VVWPNQTSLASSSEYMVTLRKTAFEKSYKKLSTSRYSRLVGGLARPDTSGVSLQLHYDTKETSLFHTCKNLNMIQWSDQVLRTSWAVTLVQSLVWPDKTLGVSSSNFMVTPRKIASENSFKKLSTIQRSNKLLWTSWAGTLVWCGLGRWDDVGIE